MSAESSGATAPTAATPAPLPASGVTTRNQHKKNEDERNADEDTHDSNRKTIKPKDPFKGKITKLSGSVFQLTEEGAKHNQFTETLTAIKKYMYIEYNHVDDLSSLFQTVCVDATLAEPPDEPPFGADKTTRVTRDHRLYHDWKDECSEYRTRLTAMKSNRIKLFNTILLQCSQDVEQKLEATAGHDAAVATHDCLWLIRTLKDVCHHFEHTENRFMALYSAKSTLYHLKQGPSQSTAEYYKLFQAQLSVIESYGGRVHDSDTAGPPEAALSSLADDTTRNTYMRDRGHAAALLSNADPVRYGTLLASLSNAFGLGRDEYPTTLNDAYQLLLRYKDPTSSTNPNRSNRHGRRNDGRGHGGNDGRGHGGRTETGRSNHGNRSGGRSPAKTFVQVSLSLAQLDNHFPDGIPNHYVLLDSNSTISIFSNPALLTWTVILPSPFSAIQPF
jgi:hypothetical protein